MINPESTENIVRHIEIKAYVDDYKAISSRVAKLVADSTANRLSGLEITPVALPVNHHPIDRVQDDTFFHCRSGRLKLRSSGQYHDLIYYRRVKDYGPSESFYQSARTGNPSALRTSLTSAFGEAGRVRKFRRTYRLGQSIIHLDRVGGLGDFIEIKVELDAQQSMMNGQGTFAYAPVLATQRTSDPSPTPSSASQSSPASAARSVALSVQQAAKVVENLMDALGVDLFQLIDGAYVDLLNEQGGKVPQMTSDS